MNLRSVYPRFASVANWLQSPLLLVIRLYWGYSAVQTGWGKLTHLSRTTDYFASLHIPLPQVNAALAGGTELIGGALLALGFCSRAAALGLTFVMCVAYATAEHEALAAIWSDTDKFTSATPFLFLYAALIILAFGPGSFSIDRFLFGSAERSAKS